MTKHTQKNPSEAEQDVPAGDDPKKTKAAIILGLIEQGVIPKPSDDFIEELVKFSGQRHSVKLADIEDASRKLARYLGAKTTTYPPRPLDDALPEAKESESGIEIAARPKDAQVEIPKDLTLRLRDQHAAIIKNHLDTLSDDDVKLTIKTLPGKTARQVALLNFQSHQWRKEG